MAHIEDTCLLTDITSIDALTCCHFRAYNPEASSFLAQAMGNGHKRDQWLQYVETRQRNVVFPETLQNEIEGWRSLSKRPLTTTSKIGLALLAIMGWGMVIIVLFAAAGARMVWPLVIGMILLWGPIFGVIAWATRRSLRQIEKTRRGRNE
jgi:hypothetical protein